VTRKLPVFQAFRAPLIRAHYPPREVTVRRDWGLLTDWQCRRLLTKAPSLLLDSVLSWPPDKAVIHPSPRSRVMNLHVSAAFDLNHHHAGYGAADEARALSPLPVLATQGAGRCFENLEVSALQLYASSEARTGVAKARWVRSAFDPGDTDP
jgi:hypothetical protein